MSALGLTEIPANPLDINFDNLLVLEMVALHYYPVKYEILLDSVKGYLRRLNLPVRIAKLRGEIADLLDQGLLGQYEDGRLLCRPELVEDLTAQMSLGGRLEHGAANLPKNTSMIRWAQYDPAAERARIKQEARLLFYRRETYLGSEMRDIGLRFSQPKSLQAFSPRACNQVVLDAFEIGLMRLQKPAACLAYLEQRWAEEQPIEASLLLLLAEQYLMQGRVDRVEALLARHPEFTSLKACLDFLEGNYEKALAGFENARNGNGMFRSRVTAFFYLLCLIRSKDFLRARLYLAVDVALQSIHSWLSWLLDTRSGQLAERPLLKLDAEEPLRAFWITLISSFEDCPSDPRAAKQLQEVVKLAAQSGYHMVEREAQLLLGGESAWKTCLPPSQRWRLALNAVAKAAQRIDHQERLVWIINWRDVTEMAPKLQKRNQRGGWTPGRAARWDELPACASDVDRLAIKRMQTEGQDAVLPLLIGHPLVFLDNDLTRPLELIAGEPQLHIERVDEQVHVYLEPAYRAKTDYGVFQEKSGRLRIVKFGEEHKRMAAALGSSGVLVPPGEEACLEELLGSLSQVVAITSDLGAGASIVEVDADSTLCLRMRPYQEGLEIQLLVRPLGKGGPEFGPGSGGRTVVGRVEGRTLQTVRDLPLQQARRETLLERCALPHEEANGWLLSDAQTSLELLEQLGPSSSELLIEWPDGQPLRIVQSAGWDRMSLAATSSSDWLELTGELKLDDGKVLEMSQLLERARGGRFIALEPGRFVALTEEFRRRLEELADFGEPGREGRFKYHPLAAGFLDELPQLQSDAAFRNRLEKLRQAEELRPEPPSTLDADLRGYQIDGFQWLAQRAHWGVGACLADDMGLGKTLQALALLVTRAPDGPALVVAPTSVCGNWAAEAARFAPTLRVRVLGQEDRQEVLANPGPFDLVIASYGLLVNEIDSLSATTWQTLVLDEAQAIKNTPTRRFQSALRLSAHMRLAMTGTPVENRLDELWALLRFLNPGLLGSLERFRSRFVTPIEAGDVQKRDRLRRLVQPFLLRRTKGQVLQELPPRTEILLDVDFSAEERAFYEALRRRALEQLQGPEVQPLNILAELTRLRRACCHPRLVLPGFAAEGGSKLQVFSKLLEEMQQGGHRALVFSQIVDHLSLLREQLERQGIAYQYLDGSTPAKERTRRVAAFQAGQGEVFLISLRAGGVGLNLTGADYVIHMDPWWNPAVEDQASDRAHRFGQQRPVTIYRLVCRHTVEEKIVALHRQKRELADSLLEGADAGVRLSAAELLRLIHDD